MNVVVRGAILLLGIFYLYVTYLMAHPNVSAAYRDYYILRTSDLSFAERKKMVSLRIDQDYGHKDTAIGFDGWSVPEEWFRWNDGKSAKLIFKLDLETVAKVPARLVLHVLTNGKQRTRWKLNGADLGERRVDGDTRLVFVLRPDFLHAGENVVEIDMSDAHRPNQSDGRALALAFVSLRLE
jgi:hypothetical protein